MILQENIPFYLHKQYIVIISVLEIVSHDQPSQGLFKAFKNMSVFTLLPSDYHDLRKKIHIWNSGRIPH